VKSDLKTMTAWGWFTTSTHGYPKLSGTVAGKEIFTSCVTAVDVETRIATTIGGSRYRLDGGGASLLRDLAAHSPMHPAVKP